jgi:hypothetical protein
MHHLGVLLVRKAGPLIRESSNLDCLPTSLDSRMACLLRKLYIGHRVFLFFLNSGVLGEVSSLYIGIFSFLFEIQSWEPGLPLNTLILGLLPWPSGRITGKLCQSP